MTFTNPWGAAFKYALLKSQCFNGLLHQMNLSFLIGLQSTGPITHIGQSSQLRNRLCPDLPSILNRGLSIHNIIKSSNRSNTDPGKLPNGESFSKQLPHCWRSVCPLVRGLWCIVWRRLLFTFAGERRHKKKKRWGGRSVALSTAAAPRGQRASSRRGPTMQTSWTDRALT